MRDSSTNQRDLSDTPSVRPGRDLCKGLDTPFPCRATSQIKVVPGPSPGHRPQGTSGANETPSSEVKQAAWLKAPPSASTVTTPVGSICSRPLVALHRLTATNTTAVGWNAAGKVNGTGLVPVVATAPLKWTIPEMVRTAGAEVPNGEPVHPFCNVKAVQADIASTADGAACAAAGAGGYRWVYCALAGIALLLALALHGVHAPPETPASNAGGSNTGWARRAGLTPVLGCFVLAGLCYVGAEIALGGFAAAYLVHQGWRLGAAALVVSAFYIGLTVGRLAAVPLTRRVAAAPLVLTCSAASVCTLLLTTVSSSAAVGYVATGVVFGPIIPTAIAWMTELDPGNPRGISWLLVAAEVGGVLATAGVAALLRSVGFAAVPAVLIFLATASLIGFLVARAVGDRANKRP
jgi:hypothetical protein